MCGCCKACARELDGQEARQRGILDAVKEMIPLDLLLGNLMDCATHLVLYLVLYISLVIKQFILVYVKKLIVNYSVLLVW